MMVGQGRGEWNGREALIFRSLNYLFEIVVVVLTAFFFGLLFDFSFFVTLELEGSRCQLKTLSTFYSSRFHHVCFCSAFSALVADKRISVLCGLKVNFTCFPHYFFT